MSKGKANPYKKGKSGELELKNKLNELLGIKAIRGRQYNGSAGNPDIILQQQVNGTTTEIPGLHVECKRTEYFQLYKALEQSESDAREGEIPVVCHRKNNDSWIIIFRLDNLPAVSKWVQSLEDNKGNDCPDEPGEN